MSAGSYVSARAEGRRIGREGMRGAAIPDTEPTNRESLQNRCFTCISQWLTLRLRTARFSRVILLPEPYAGARGVASFHQDNRGIYMKSWVKLVRNDRASAAFVVPGLRAGRMKMYHLTDFSTD